MGSKEKGIPHLCSQISSALPPGELEEMGLALTGGGDQLGGHRGRSSTADLKQSDR
jgi:hypothetical protein